MNGNFCRALADRRPMAPSACMQLALSPPPGHSCHPVPDTVAAFPFWLHPTDLDPNCYNTCGSVISYVPFHRHFGVCDYPFEPAFIQKRNERERRRVKCVNEGYARLRGHLPGTMSEKRLSKVETLRAAIRYIKYLQDVLSRSPEGTAPEADSSLAERAAPSCSLAPDCSDEESKVTSSSSCSALPSSSPEPRGANRKDCASTSWSQCLEEQRLSTKAS
ncbi:achaete-scute homolog 5 [Alligator mississippiensis]|uniref:achaete-scute homolog 5 n=1 Tax=Alligator mississippiensis TaxID=8496 RepID=UPI0003D075C3|nr:achaete-scute homolog 5 [Alligator mississippiensis]XP_059573209.1 achaete-scute homolog 5 [Alligator mississippiensis]